MPEASAPASVDGEPAVTRPAEPTAAERHKFERADLTPSREGHVQIGIKAPTRLYAAIRREAIQREQSMARMTLELLDLGLRVYTMRKGQAREGIREQAQTHQGPLSKDREPDVPNSITPPPADVNAPSSTGADISAGGPLLSAPRPYKITPRPSRAILADGSSSAPRGGAPLDRVPQNHPAGRDGYVGDRDEFDDPDLDRSLNADLQRRIEVRRGGGGQ